ncbi:MAG: Txe/YoeB family addiction module toxin [Selenomonadaceae bacterium]|nr:Txe/YoeB family addiction module toxin [Selenomonadaceae bacterium]
MDKIFSDKSFEQYLYWQDHDENILQKINLLIQSIERDGVDCGLGNPEKLPDADGYSRRIDEKNRLVYDIDAQGYLYIISCKGHY